MIKQGDCLELMKEIPDGSVDMILTDPPFGTTDCPFLANAFRRGINHEPTQTLPLRMDMGKIIGRRLFEREENASPLPRKYFSLLSEIADLQSTKMARQNS